MIFKIVMAALACALWICSIIIVKKETEVKMFWEMIKNISVHIVTDAKNGEEDNGEN